LASLAAHLQTLFLNFGHHFQAFYMCRSIQLKVSLCLRVFGKIAVFMSVAFTAQFSVAEIITFESSDEKSVLLELYTSQGCSSCPPAENWFSEFTEDERLWTQVFPIAFHVDYWDYLGWRDPFSAPAYSARQRRYERYQYVGNVATPGFVVDGKGWNGWFRGLPLPASTAVENKGSLNVEIKGRNVMARFSSERKFKASPKVHMAILGFGIVTPIKAGENRGKHLNHDFVALAYHSNFLLETVDGWQVNMKRPSNNKYSDSRQALVIWVSDGDDPKPIQVTGGWLK
jgi:hypothetical protein